jgi:SAM-dependent methyltransferase
MLRNAVANYGPSILKEALWDREYSAGKWYFNDNTAGDCLYPHLEKFAQNGSILDIGCGSGNTANELAATAYGTYLGVDISDAALEKARSWSEANGRVEKNQFARADMLEYVPSQRFDVILFRESLYLVPLGKVKVTLDRYSEYLKDGGVFVVRICTARDGKRRHRPTAMLRVIESGFDVVEKSQYGEFGPTVIVFRPTASPGAKRTP